MIIKIGAIDVYQYKMNIYFMSENISDQLSHKKVYKHLKTTYNNKP